MSGEANENGATVESQDSSISVYFATLFGWLVPGLGHLILKKWGRAAVFFGCIGGLALAGYAMRGQAYALIGEGAFATLGGLAQLGAGAFYFLAHVFERSGPDIASATGEYSTHFLVIAGLLNYLAVLDAWDIARRGKN